MAYIVPHMKLIPQNKNMSCWYASAQMLIQWRRDQMQASEASYEDPSEDPLCAAMRDRDKGLLDSQIIAMAKQLGLKEVPPMSPTPEAIERWLKSYGPLWVNGKKHIVVIAGIKGQDQVLVYDPWPPHVGKVDWRSLSKWYAGGSSASSVDTTTNAAVFLHIDS